MLKDFADCKGTDATEVSDFRLNGSNAKEVKNGSTPQAHRRPRAVLESNLDVNFRSTIDGTTNRPHD